MYSSHTLSLFILFFLSISIVPGGPEHILPPMPLTVCDARPVLARPQGAEHVQPAISPLIRSVVPHYYVHVCALCVFGNVCFRISMDTIRTTTCFQGHSQAFSSWLLHTVAGRHVTWFPGPRDEWSDILARMVPPKRHVFRGAVSCGWLHGKPRLLFICTSVWGGHSGWMHAVGCGCNTSCS